MSNLYNYKLLNKTYQEMTLHFEPENFKGRIELVGEKNLKVPKGGDLSGSLFVYMDSAAIRHTETDIKIGVWQNQRR